MLRNPRTIAAEALNIYPSDTNKFLFNMAEFRKRHTEMFGISDDDEIAFERRVAKDFLSTTRKIRNGKFQSPAAKKELTVIFEKLEAEFLNIRDAAKGPEGGDEEYWKLFVLRIIIQCNAEDNFHFRKKSAHLVLEAF